MGKTDARRKIKKTAVAFLNILSYIFFAFCIIAIVLSVGIKRSYDDAVNIFGRQMRIVVSDSMAKYEGTNVENYDIKDIPVKSMIFIETVPEDEAEALKWYGELAVGDVLTFRYLYSTQVTITHRIISITEKDSGGYIIELDGDNRASENVTTSKQVIDTSIKDSPNYVIGKVTAQSYTLGLLITAAKSPIGIVLIIIIPCFIIAILEVIRLVGAITEGKRKKEKDEALKRDLEFEEMKRQLEELKKQAASNNENNDINKNI